MNRLQKISLALVAQEKTNARSRKPVPRPVAPRPTVSSTGGTTGNKTG